jgi:hypothetical protein
VSLRESESPWCKAYPRDELGRYLVASIDAPALLAFVAGITGTVAAFGAKYLFDYRLAKRQLEFDERSGLATSLGGRPGQLRRAAARLHDRTTSFERDAQNLDSWLRPAEQPKDDGYYLTSSVQRVFMYATYAALLQQAMDSLPHETLRARRDLQTQYVLLDLATEALTNIGMLEGFPGYPKDRASYQLFTGTLDDVADLGVRIFNQNSQVVPTSEFLAAYRGGERYLMQVREWLSAMRHTDARGTVITARMFALGAILRCYLRSDAPAFVDDLELRTRLGGLSKLPAAKGYDFGAQIPPWLDRATVAAEQRWSA